MTTDRGRVRSVIRRLMHAFIVPLLFGAISFTNTIPHEEELSATFTFNANEQNSLVTSCSYEASKVGAQSNFLISHYIQYGLRWYVQSTYQYPLTTYTKEI